MKITRALIVNLIAFVFLFLFVYTALSKFLDFTHFQFVLRHSPLLGSLGVSVSWFVPGIELLIALLLFEPRSRLAGLFSSMILMIVFSIYIGYMLFFSPQLPCSCGGVIEQLSWTQHLGLNLILILLAGYACYLEATNPSRSSKILLQ
jgi:hypothetical protein